MQRYDVVVIGAGLVGSLAALKLARQGVRVCVLEKNCWHTAPYGPLINGVSQKLNPFWQHLQLNQALDDATLSYGHRIRVQFKHLKRHSLCGDWHPPRRFILRNQFNLAIRHQLQVESVTFYDEVQTIDVLKNDFQSATLQLSQRHQGVTDLPITCRWVLVCDGASSLTAKQLGIKPYFKGASYLYQGAWFDSLDLPHDEVCLLPLAHHQNLLSFTGSNTSNPSYAQATYLEIETRLNPLSVAQKKPPTARTRQARPARQAVLPFGTSLSFGKQPTAYFNHVLNQHPLSKRWLPLPLAKHEHAMTWSVGYQEKWFEGCFFLLGDSAARMDPLASAGLWLGVSAFQAWNQLFQQNKLSLSTALNWQKNEMKLFKQLLRKTAVLRWGLNSPALSYSMLPVITQIPYLKNKLVRLP